MIAPSFPGTQGVVSAIRHLGWWFDWHTRARPTDACRQIDD